MSAHKNSANKVLTIGKSRINIGRFTYGQENLSIRQYGEGANLTIGSFCSLASSITIFLGGNHRTDWITTYPFGHINQEELGDTKIFGHPASNGDVTIGHDVWIGHGVTIMSGITIGDGAVLAANSTVTKDVRPYDIQGGNPAKTIRARFSREITQLLLELRWWELPVQDIKNITQDLSATPRVELLNSLLNRYRPASARNQEKQADGIPHQGTGTDAMCSNELVDFQKIAMSNHRTSTRKIHVNVCIMQPQGYIHSLGLLDPARYFRHKLRELGASVSLSKNRLQHGAINFIFGAHLGFDPAQRQRHTCIFVNLEQLGHGGAQVPKSYLDLLSSSAVVDYDPENTSAYTNYPEDVPIAHFVSATYLARENEQPSIPIGDRPIDLLFFGSMNERRKKMLDRIEMQGISVSVFDQPVYCDERDHYIRQAKAVLNCHFYESSRFEQVRVSHCLSLGTPVVSERSANTHPAQFYEDAVSWFSDENIEEFFSSKFGTPAWQEQAQNQLAYFKRLDATENFAEILEFAQGYHQGHARHVTAGPWRPVRMNLGSGKDYKPGWLNVDILERAEPDVVMDLSQKVQLPIDMKSRTCGLVHLSRGQFETIYANNVLEHVPDLTGLMTQCLDLLAEGGLFEIEVPYERALTAWQDPTHIRALNENSWVYYTQWFWYLGWFEHRFEIEKSCYLDTQLNPCEKERAAFMRVTLKKIPTTAHERTVARTMQANWIVPDDEIACDQTSSQVDGEMDEIGPVRQEVA